MIKIEHTKTHTVTIPRFDPNDCNILNVLVTDGKLVLVWGDCRKEEFYKYNIESHDKTQFAKPILISETEKIEDGELCLLSNGNIVKYEGDQGLKHTLNPKKVLALPEHFSPEQLQMIVDGKLRDGDKVLVECEKNIIYNKVWWCEDHKPVKYQNFSNVIPTSIYQEGSSTGLQYKVHIALPTGQIKVDLSEIEIEENNQMIIKLNPHITIYPVEEKMLPMSLVKVACEQAFDRVINLPHDTTSFSTWWEEHQEWFEQNVK